jgi:diaminobutyrate-2-oxoglutarate transaminase
VNPSSAPGRIDRGDLLTNAFHGMSGALAHGNAPDSGNIVVHGLAFDDGKLAGKVSTAALELGLLVETAGLKNEVVKLLPPLTITDAELDKGLELLSDAARAVC